MRSSSLGRLSLFKTFFFSTLIWINFIGCLRGVIGSGKVVGRIAFNEILSNLNQIPTDSRVILSSESSRKAFIRSDGTFSFQDLKPGEYILRVQCRKFNFPILKVQVPITREGEEDEPIPIIKPYIIGRLKPSQPKPPSSSSQSNHGIRSTQSSYDPQLQYPIQLSPLSILQYYETPVGFNPISMLLGNPMYLIMGGMAIFMMLMPKLLNMLDPEALAELQENQANMHKQMASIRDMDFSSGLSNILTAPQDDEIQNSSKPNQIKNSSSNRSNNGPSLKKRK